MEKGIEKNMIIRRSLYIMIWRNIKNIILNQKYFLNRKIDFEIINGNVKGKVYYGNGKLEFEGEYLNGKKNGKGKEYFDNGKLRFEGYYLNGKRNGKGKEYSNGKLIFEGEYLNGKRWNGKEYDYDGKLIYEGEYLNGNRFSFC